ncbi:ribokinase [candidate division CSSED10-310 bacterium]|uniref:Ribokinase n=1 Tax=candidate division CSSED10-310 bacterium TaxID=2855610 RepID=A0ABV6Z5B4_UNCC1
MVNKLPKVVVVGSANMDLVVRAPRIPLRGETILGSDFQMIPGGKGANQAVAASKLGAAVWFIARLGADPFGSQLKSNLEKEGVETSFCSWSDQTATGVALITVDEGGENVIVVAPGANQLLGLEDIQAAEQVIASAQVVVAQLEIPLETIHYTASLTQTHHVPFILDPAPAQPLEQSLLSLVDVITPNETEARILTGVEVSDKETARVAALRLMEQGVGSVIITLGSKGYFIAHEQTMNLFPAPSVKVIDSTAAGDAFTGALAFSLAHGSSLAQAAQFANCGAALSVTQMGAQPSMPTREEVNHFRKNLASQVD